MSKSQYTFEEIEPQVDALRKRNEELEKEQKLLEELAAKQYLDFNTSWNLDVLGSQSQIFFKVENVFDTDPPRIASTAGTAYASSGTEGGYYDLIGRYFRLGFRFKY